LAHNPMVSVRSLVRPGHAGQLELEDAMPS
jgi:hypothetical protein